VEKFEVVIKKSALKQLKKFPVSVQSQILASIKEKLTKSPYIPDGKHIKKLTEGYRLRIDNYRIFYFIQKTTVTITSIVRRTSTTY